MGYLFIGIENADMIVDKVSVKELEDLFRVS